MISFKVDWQFLLTNYVMISFKMRWPFLQLNYVLHFPLKIPSPIMYIYHSANEKYSSQTKCYCVTQDPFLGLLFYRHIG